MPLPSASICRVTLSTGRYCQAIGDFLWILIDGNQTMCVCPQDLPTRLLVAGAGTTADGSKRWDFAISAAPDWSTCSPGPALLSRPSLSGRGPAVSIRRGKEKKLNRLTASTSPAILYRFYNFFFLLFSLCNFLLFIFRSLSDWGLCFSFLVSWVSTRLRSCR